MGLGKKSDIELDRGGAERLIVIEAVNYNPVYNLLFTNHAYVKKRNN